ncbi:hypothetical protein PBY51_003112 [Eleginops maclovinus]|uniref:Uncharacterized protein n=1 Tax=Eleginops maclovinus TaxID=56733 RepID=A0AAN7XEB0_ELEMC|nr:hypothetical protein PBY51_003112 [Eleginops maclovinus]
MEDTSRNVVAYMGTFGDRLVCVFLCLYAGVRKMVHLPVAILWCSLPAWRAFGLGAERESIALTITSFPPHGSLSAAELRLSGHIIVSKMPVVDPIKQESHFLSMEYIPKRNVI